MINIRLPYPPSLNHYYRTVNNRIRISAKGKTYRQNVIAACLSQLKCYPKLAGRLSVRIIATMPDKRRRDLDNTLKATLDSLQHAGVYLDDAQIDDLHIIRSAVDKPGWLDIEIIDTKGIY